MKAKAAIQPSLRERTSWRKAFQAGNSTKMLNKEASEVAAD